MVIQSRQGVRGTQRAGDGWVEASVEAQQQLSAAGPL